MPKTRRKPLQRRLGDMLDSLLNRASRLAASLPRLPDPVTTVALIVGLLLMCWALSGCSPRVQTVKPVLPPQAEARPMPAFTGDTYRDAILYLIEVREWGMACEYDKDAIRSVLEKNK